MLLVGCLCVASGLARAELAVIVNIRAGVATMTRNEVINIFFGRSRQFFNGNEAQPVDLLDSHPDRARFYQLLIGKDLTQVDSYWSRQFFSGSVRPPPKLASSEEVIKWVSSNAAGIGYVDASKVDARVRVVLELTH